ncbi:MAG TPA: hypothetical protein VHM19_23135 [Polyangiales bacterium]|jgi:hypothetical protein|nr:hypothetical protein [Polyangiales bacterium]
MLLTDHQTNEANRGLEIEPDERDPQNGNASHVYKLRCKDGPEYEPIRFQHGPIKEVGQNGVTNEALLAIVIDRLRGFQSSPFSCRENAIALTKIEEALHWLHSRTRAREQRGVEGTNVA